MQVVGVDGCPGGWIAMCWRIEEGTITPSVHASLADLIGYHAKAAAIGIDMPIGLSTNGTRQCDLEARRLLGPGRSSSVFPPPVPAILDAASYVEAVERSREAIGRGMSRQSFAIFGKLHEANSTVTPDIQDRVFEVHPEVSFWALAARPMLHQKGRQEGYDERRALLVQATGLQLPDRKSAFGMARPAKPDDMLDAVVAAWTARRVAEGREGRLPRESEVDATGLRMEIVY